MMGILSSHKEGSRKKIFQITSDGQICDDSASESESESDEEKPEEEEEEDWGDVGS